MGSCVEQLPFFYFHYNPYPKIKQLFVQPIHYTSHLGDVYIFLNMEVLLPCTDEPSRCKHNNKKNNRSTNQPPTVKSLV